MVTQFGDKWLNFKARSKKIALGITLYSLCLPILSAQAQTKIYDPPAITSETEIADTLSQNDIPTGDGGFARDYFVELEKGDQVTIDLTSDNFDSMVILIAEDGAKVAENDDGPDGTTNSLLFSRITEGGKYIVRVRAYGDTSGGKFTLKLTRLQPTLK
ncbi:MAG: PPC domain-containing protein [Cyanobacteria bacterium P01_C01_bin.72]